jgi:hypothetical protein
MISTRDATAIAPKRHELREHDNKRPFSVAAGPLFFAAIYS